MEKQFPFIVSDISGVLWRKKAFDFYKLCNFHLSSLTFLEFSGEKKAISIYRL